MSTQKKLSVKKVSAALMKYNGILSDAAKACRCSRMAMYKFIEQHPELEEVRAEARDVLLDVAESHVATAINGGNLKTVQWYLERQGKDRGYVTRVEETGKDGAPLEFGMVERRIVDPEEGK